MTKVEKAQQDLEDRIALVRKEICSDLAVIKSCADATLILNAGTPAKRLIRENQLRIVIAEQNILRVVIEAFGPPGEMSG